MVPALENVHTSAYVVDSDYRLVYFNKTLEKLFPGIRTGATCFRTLRGQSEPCADCPLRVMSDEKALTYNQYLQCWVETEAGDIEWPGAGPCHILLCREADDPGLNEPDQEPFNALTGLRGRMAFLRSTADLLASHPGRPYCLMVVDIEHFKLFNELYGEEAGDRFLGEMGALLAEVEKEHDVVAGYFLGDDFCIMLPQVEAVIEDVQERLADTARRSGGVGFLPAFGLYAIDDASLPIGTMYDRAMLALASIKGNYAQRSCWYDEGMTREMEDDHALLLGVQSALQNGEFTIFVQPKCNMSTGKVVGLEALARWDHPERGIISPGQFIPMLERNGLITTLDLHMWEQACQALRAWMDGGRLAVPISVNVSRRDMYAIDVVETFEALVKTYDIDPRLLEIEITESAFVEDYEMISTIVDRLRAAGFTVLMDDFGSGYSSLSMLKDVNVDVLKLDIKLLDVDDDRIRKGRGILESIISMARLVDLRIIAEGVETKEQRDFLLKAGCLYAQGYYFHRPMPLPEVEKLLADPANVDYRGVQANPVGRLQVRQLLNENVLSDTMMDDILGPIAFYDVGAGQVELVGANDQYCRLMGMSAIDLQEQRRSITKLVYDADWGAFLDAFDRAHRQAPQGAEVDVRRMREDGGTVCVHARLFFLRERDGRHLYYGSLTDVTEQRMKALQLESSQRALAAVVGVSTRDQAFMSLAEVNRRTAASIFAQMSPGGMIGGYCEEGFPLYFANAEMVKLLGYDSYEEFAEAIEWRVGNTIHPDDLPSVQEDIGPEYFAGLEYTTTYRMPRKDGTWFWTLDKGRVVEAEDGRLAIVSACTDITDVMSAQERATERNKLLLSRNKELSFLNEDMPGGYHRCLYSPGFDFLYVSDRFLELFGYTRQEIKELFDDKFANMVHPDDRAVVAKGVAELKEGKGTGSVSLEYRMKAKDGYVWVVDQSRFLEYEGVTFLQGVVVDATETMELRNCMRALVDHIDDDIVVFSWEDREDVDVRVVSCASLEAFDLSLKECARLIRRRLYETHPGEGRRLVDDVADAVERGEDLVVIEPVHYPGGSAGQLRIDVKCIGEGPGTHRALCLCSEVETPAP